MRYKPEVCMRLVLRPHTRKSTGATLTAIAKRRLLRTEARATHDAPSAHPAPGDVSFASLNSPKLAAETPVAIQLEKVSTKLSGADGGFPSPPVLDPWELSTHRSLF